jgi:hypothetical protein
MSLVLYSGDKQLTMPTKRARNKQQQQSYDGHIDLRTGRKNSANNVMAEKLLDAGIQMGTQLVKSGVDRVINFGKNQLANRTRKIRATQIADIPHIPGAPVSIGTRLATSSPKFSTTAGSITVTHRELLGFVTLSTQSTSDLGFVNPTNPYLFPWLSTIAGMYDKYRINSLVLDYIPTCATSQTGQVALAWDPSGNDATTTYIEMFNMKCVNSQPWLPLSLRIPPSDVKLMGENAVSSSVAQDYYNHGRLTLGVDGSGTTGMHYMTYSITLLNPQPTAPVSTVIDASNTASNTNITSYTTLIGPPLKTVAGGFLLPPGFWKLSVIAIGTGISDITLTFGPGTNHVNEYVAGEGAASTTAMEMVFLSSAGALTSYFNAKTTYTTLTSFLFRLQKIDGNSYNTSSILI